MTSPAGQVTVSREVTMAQGLAHYRAGHLVQAAQCYATLLAADPNDAEALHLAGITADAQGDPTRAVGLIRRSLALRDSAGRWSNLGMALGHMRRHAEALDCYGRALALRPGYPEALNNLGVSLDALKRPAEAEAAYRQAVAARPGYAEALGNLGNTLRVLGRPADAVAAYEQALASNPAGPRTALGHALREAGRPDAAMAAFRQDAAAHPDDPAALTNLAAALAGPAAPEYPARHAHRGGVLQQLGRLEEAVAACERALALQPDNPAALSNLGIALRGLGRLADSEVALRRAVALRPAEAGGYNALAVTLQDQDRPHEALAVLDLALALDPDYAEAHHHRAMILLRQGRLAEGWGVYDWRFRIRQAGNSYARFAGQTPWRGEPIAGRTILLVPEQGFGDTIQLVRYAPLVAARGTRVVLGVQPGLIRLLTGLPGVAQIVALGEALPAYDIHCPLLSLPRAFGTTLDSIPATVPYLVPETAAAARWAARLAGPGLRVGIVWAGNPNHPGDRERSLPPAMLAPLWDVPGVRWFSFQLGQPAPGPAEDLAPELTDFAETAAALAGLDLVIAADTAVAHLAGALGRPVWVLLPATPDWRWLRTGDGSPWYPTMRLFRQDVRRSWAPVIEHVAEALRERVHGG